MIDLADAVQAALFTRLSAGVTLGTVYTIVPDKTQPPVAVIGDSQAEQIGGKGSDAERHEVVIRAMVAGTSRRALLALMTEVKEALHNQPLTAAGALLSNAVLTSSNSIRDVEEKVLIGEQSFTIFAQPAL
jgi:hypothetical protein